jgi:hypothetical protein
VNPSAAPALVLAAIVSAAAATAQDAPLDEAVRLAGAYVAQFRGNLSGIVSEETYVQDVSRAPGSSIEVFSGGGQGLVLHRELTSDLLLVRPDGADRPIDFRDVFQVDGRPVRDRQERLTRLFLDPSPSASQRIDEILAESARLNIGSVYRNVNTPTLALMFLEPEHQRRFRFTRGKETPPALASGWSRESNHFAPPPGSTVIDYQEVQRNTLIRRTTSGGDMPVRGRFWIESATGRVLLTELLISDPLIQCTIDVSFQSEPLAGLLVPIEMRERYVNNRDRSIITGTATYGRFRRFQVTVDEKLPR